MTPETRALVEAIGCEILARTACEPPPPSDLASERLLVAGLLCGDRPEVTLPERGDFMSPLLGALWDMGVLLWSEGKQVTAELMLVALRDQGWIGPVERELLALRDETPAVARSVLEEAAETVVELSERRRLIRLCGRVEGGLRAGSVDAVDAIRELRGCDES
jgi:hypothetical protein